MRHLFVALIVAAVGTSLGCGATTSQLQNRAAYDFNCPSSQLRVTRIDGRTMGVSGCGQQATYVESCEQTGWGRNCTWVKNSQR